MFFSNQLMNISNLKHCFFSRKNGVSKGIYNSLNCGLGSKDDKKNVIQNINIVCKKLNCEKKPIITLNQTHSNKVVCFNNREEVKDKMIGDAIVTKLKNIGIGVLTADCVPILFCDPQKKIIGCIHSGWKGALNGVIKNTVKKFKELNSNIDNLIAVVGPCIGKESYEVKIDFYKKFLSQHYNPWTITQINSAITRAPIISATPIIMLVNVFLALEILLSLPRAITNNSPP